MCFDREASRNKDKKYGGFRPFRSGTSAQSWSLSYVCVCVCVCVCFFSLLANLDVHARAQDVVEVSSGEGLLVVDGEDGARRHVAVDVRRAVEGVERHAVLACQKQPTNTRPVTTVATAAAAAANGAFLSVHVGSVHHRQAWPRIRLLFSTNRMVRTTRFVAGRQHVGQNEAVGMGNNLAMNR